MTALADVRSATLWGRMQVELLNHSALGMLTPNEYENRHFNTQDAA